ncbi:cupin domain-containing protein [Pseudomonas sp. RIT-To-2]|uniref:cupin domain-containing protein n=1 Tax=Pseudomonas sp. RIT-To-2 TaxID=3462541 RepID=UPI00241323D9
MNLVEQAQRLPHAWRSRILGRTGGAQLKVIRMDEAGIELESHEAFDEALLVIEGHLQLEIEGEVIEMGPGDFHLIPSGQRHRVLPGSQGTLFLIDAP